MDKLQNQVSARVEASVTEITELARAYQALSAGSIKESFSAIRGMPAATHGRKGSKRRAEESAQMADVFLAYVTADPGQRVERIAKKLGLPTPELTLPAKKS